MKKTLAMLLAVLMLLSTTAFATTFDSVTNGDNTGWYDGQNPTGDNEDADIDVYVDTRYTDGPDSFAKEAEAATEIWLQVDATGQIDVTVPLVLVFQTNIDGGDAVSPDEYKITNHSSADLVVTKITTTTVATDSSKQPMTMVDWGTGNMKEDTYAVAIQNIGGTAGANNHRVRDTYDLNQTHEGYFNNAALKGGLFELAKAPANNYETGTDTELEIAMKTGRLSFVTSRDGNDVMDQNKGIQLLTITYTVAIDTSDAIGDDITTAANRTDADRILDSTNVNDYYEHSRVTPVTSSSALKNQEDVAASNP